MRGAAVAANVNPKLLYTAMIPSDALEPAFLRRMRGWRCGSGTFRINVALSELPSFSALPGRAPADHHTAGIILGAQPGLHGSRLLRFAAARMEP